MSRQLLQCTPMGVFSSSLHKLHTPKTVVSNADIAERCQMSKWDLLFVTHLMAKANAYCLDLISFLFMYSAYIKRGTRQLRYIITIMSGGQG